MKFTFIRTPFFVLSVTTCKKQPPHFLKYFAQQVGGIKAEIYLIKNLALKVPLFWGVGVGGGLFYNCFYWH